MKGTPTSWLMWGIPALLFLIGFFHRVSPGVMAKDLMQAFEASGKIVGLLSAMYFYAYAGLMIPGGVLLDAWGARRVIAGGSAVMAAGTLVMGAAEAQGTLFLGRFLVGAGATVTFTGALTIAAAWFPPGRFGTMSAITATVGVLGSLVATAPLAWLMAAVGWRRAMVAVGAATLVGAALCAWLVRDRPPGREETPGSGPRLRPVIRGMATVLANRHTWPPFLAFFCLNVGTANLMLWVVPYLSDVYGMTTAEAALYATAMATALLVTGPLTGYLSDRVLRRRKLPFTVLTGCSAVLWLVFVLTLGALPPWRVYLLFFAMGVVGGSFVLTWPVGREVNPPHLAGVAVAVANLGGFLGAALSQAPFGAVLDARWVGVMADGARVYPLEAYRLAFGICAGFVLAGCLATLLIRETRGRNIHHELYPAREPAQG
ncbi:MAG: MFS transporter [Candidatus Rokubacteria bacterium]|nr:MFS transporter [Candidatus Rokubacteria bacterium]